MLELHAITLYRVLTVLTQQALLLADYARHLGPPAGIAAGRLFMTSWSSIT